MKLFFIYVFTVTLVFNSFSQSMYNGRYQIVERNFDGSSYTFFVFNRTANTMKAKYFARGAYNQYISWRNNSNLRILFVAPGAFSTAWTPDGLPVGLCVDNGTIVNRTTEATMDGFVIVYNGGGQVGGIGINDSRVRPLRISQGLPSPLDLRPRDNASDRLQLVNWGRDEGLTVFQTQLVYSRDRLDFWSGLDLRYGNRRERRFLILATNSQGNQCHIIADHRGEEYLNLLAQRTKRCLENDGYTVQYILNLDTGSKNFIQYWNGSRDVYEQRCTTDDCRIENATNMVVYYTEN